MTQNSLLDDTFTKEASTPDTRSYKKLKSTPYMQAKRVQYLAEGYQRPPHDYLNQVELAKEMVDWIAVKLNDKQPVTLDSFPHFKKIVPFYFKNIANHNEEFKMYLDIARSMITEYLTIGSWTRQLDGNFVAKTLPMYDYEYAEYVERLVKLKDENQANIPMTVIIEEFPRTNMVPERIEHKDE